MTDLWLVHDTIFGKSRYAGTLELSRQVFICDWSMTRQWIKIRKSQVWIIDWYVNSPWHSNLYLLHSFHPCAVSLCEGCRTEKLISFRTMSYVQGHCRPTFCCLQHTIHWRKSCSSQPARTGPDVSRLPRGSQDHPQATGYTWYSLIIGEFIAETCQSCCPCTTILLQGGLVLKRATGFFNANGAQIS